MIVDGQLYIEHWLNRDTGTTGTPKGVDVCHRNVTNLVCLAPGALEITRGTYVGQVLNISFDMGKLYGNNAL